MTERILARNSDGHSAKSPENFWRGVVVLGQGYKIKPRNIGSFVLTKYTARLLTQMNPYLGQDRSITPEIIYIREGIEDSGS